MMPTSLDELSRTKSAFETLASSSQAMTLASSANAGSNQLLPSLALLVAKAHGLSGNADFVKKRDDEVAAMVERGRAIDSSFPAAEQAAKWKPSPGLPVEYRAGMPEDVLREKATQARRTREDIDRAKQRTFSGFNTTTSKTILIEAVQSSGRNAKSIRDALRYDVSQRYGRREWLFRWKQSDYDPGEQQRPRKQARREHYAGRALEKSISLAVDTIKSHKNVKNVETATIALALAVASDKALIPAFNNHDAFQDLVGSVASENPALGQLVDLARTWTDKREEARLDRVHAISDPELIYKMRVGREASADFDVTGKVTRRRDTNGTEREGNVPSTGRESPLIERHRHQEYGGKFDKQRSTTFSSHAFSTNLRHFALLQVPGGQPVELLSEKRQSAREMNTIREQIHRARMRAADMVGTISGDGSDSLELVASRLEGKLVVKVTENTGYESRPEAERRSRTRAYVSGAGEVAQDANSRTVYVTPREIMSDRASDIILRRVGATVGVEMPRRSETRIPNTPALDGHGELNANVEQKATAMIVKREDQVVLTERSETSEIDKDRNATILPVDHAVGGAEIKKDEKSELNYGIDASKKIDLLQTRQEAGQGNVVEQVDVGAAAGKQALEPALDGYPFEAGDQIELTEDSEKLEMNQGRKLTIQSVDHETGETEIMNEDEEEDSFNYKTDPSVKFTLLQPTRRLENTLDNDGSVSSISTVEKTGLRRLNSRRSTEPTDRDKVYEAREHHAIRTM